MRPLCLVTLLVSIGFVGGCKKEYEALPESACPELVAHTKKLLGEGIKDKTTKELLAMCRSSSPKQRGCAKVATVGADIMKCSLVRD